MTPQEFYKSLSKERAMEITPFELAESYLKHRVEAITDDEILECVKHSDNGITVYRDGVSSIRNFKNKLLK